LAFNADFKLVHSRDVGVARTSADRDPGGPRDAVVDDVGRHHLAGHRDAVSRVVVVMACCDGGQCRADVRHHCLDEGRNRPVGDRLVSSQSHVRPAMVLVVRRPHAEIQSQSRLERAVVRHDGLAALERMKVHTCHRCEVVVRHDEMIQNHGVTQMVPPGRAVRRPWVHPDRLGPLPDWVHLEHLEIQGRPVLGEEDHNGPWHPVHLCHVDLDQLDHLVKIYLRPELESYRDRVCLSAPCVLRQVHSDIWRRQRDDLVDQGRGGLVLSRHRH
jgi:hypothetical protein